MSVPEKHIGARASNIKGRPETRGVPTVSNRRPCLHCRGLGKTVVREEWHEDGRPKTTEYQICSWCHGKGWQPEDGFEFPPPGTIRVGDYTAPLKHPFSIGYGASTCDVFPVHQEFDRDVVRLRNDLVMPVAELEDAGYDVGAYLRERMAKEIVAENEALAAKLFGENIKDGMTLREARREAHAEAGRRRTDTAKLIRDRLADTAEAIRACAPLASAVGQRTWSLRHLRDDEMTPDHTLRCWERPDDDWEGISPAGKRRILSARRRRVLKDKIRPKVADRRIREAKRLQDVLGVSRGIPSWDKVKD